jgi:aminopeptidase-like protein
MNVSQGDMKKMTKSHHTLGEEMHSWATELFPLNRSLTGDGTIKTFEFFAKKLENFEFINTPSGTEVFDWTVPKVWNMRSGYIKNLAGDTLVDFGVNNLHVVGYSEPVHGFFTKDELREHIFFLVEQPSAIPYVTSYYRDMWGFCLKFEEWENLGEGPFEVIIDAEKIDGDLVYGETFLAGESSQEILFSTYVCHPSMANNELSGPVVLTKLMQYLSTLKDRHYSYRAVFLPETIGALVFLNKNLERLKQNLVAGWVMTCLGDGGNLSYIPSRLGNTYADRITLKTLSDHGKLFKKYSWLDRGSDERQYCAPGIDLPVCSVTKTKYGEYAEYHTSLDNLEYISPEGLEDSLEFYVQLIENLEANRTPKIRTIGEPHLSKYQLYRSTSIKYANNEDNLLNVISYLDGQHNMQEISQLCKIGEQDVLEEVEKLRVNDLLS